MEEKTCLIATVGGTPEPVLHSIGEHRPGKIWLVCTTESKGTAEDLLSIVPDIYSGSTLPSVIVKILSNPDRIGVCFNEILAIINEILSQTDRTNVIADITAGTKCMSSALAMSAFRKGIRFSYISGDARSKDGLGTVLSGHEIARLDTDPDEFMGISFDEEVNLLFNYGRYQAVIDLIDRKDRLKFADSSELRLAFVRKLSDVCAKWELLDHARAASALSELIRTDPENSSEQPVLRNLSLNSKLKDNLAHLRLCTSNEKAYIVDLLNNADRRSLEGKFDEACLKIYRSLEALGQWRFQHHFGRGPTEFPIDKIPENLRSEFSKRYSAGNSPHTNLPLFASYKVLHAVNDEFAARFFENSGQLQRFLRIRNSSVLAHGKTIVNEAEFNYCRKIAITLYGNYQKIVFPTIPL